MLIGYARVSTTAQDLSRQEDSLKKAGVAPERIWTDKKTGATTNRPGLADLLGYAREGDTIVVHTLDRLGRNLRETLNTIHDLRERGIGVKTLTDPLPIDTSQSSALADLTVSLLALFAEMERVFSRERAAHASAVANKSGTGRPQGRPRKVTDEMLATARLALDDGQGVAQVARQFGISQSALYRGLARTRPAAPPRLNRGESFGSGSG